MRGSGAGYGFEAITDIGRSLEEAARARDADAVRKRAAELAAYLERVQVAFG